MWKKFTIGGWLRHGTTMGLSTCRCSVAEEPLGCLSSQAHHPWTIRMRHVHQGENVTEIREHRGSCSVETPLERFDADVWVRFPFDVSIIGGSFLCRLFIAHGSLRHICTCENIGNGAIAGPRLNLVPRILLGDFQATMEVNCPSGVGRHGGSLTTSPLKMLGYEFWGPGAEYTRRARHGVHDLTLTLLTSQWTVRTNTMSDSSLRGREQDLHTSNQCHPRSAYPHLRLLPRTRFRPCFRLDHLPRCRTDLLFGIILLGWYIAGRCAGSAVNTAGAGRGKIGLEGGRRATRAPQPSGWQRSLRGNSRVGRFAPPAQDFSRQADTRVESRSHRVIANGRGSRHEYSMNSSAPKRPPRSLNGVGIIASRSTDPLRV